MYLASDDILGDIPAYCEKHNITGSLANIAALLMAEIKNINWVGFYLYDGERLRLGPFQGKPACTEIALGRGVCGTAAAKHLTVVVPDVEKFPGHIVCDSSSRSEIVVPIMQHNTLIGVLDVDSAELNRFSSSDQKFFEGVVKVILANLNFEVKGKK